jgi:hypothetical protein
VKPASQRLGKWTDDEDVLLSKAVTKQQEWMMVARKYQVDRMSSAKTVDSIGCSQPSMENEVDSAKNQCWLMR